MSRVHADTLELNFHLADEWRLERFLSTVELLTGEPADRAEAIARATLQTLGERLALEQARALSAEMPEQLRAWLLVSDAEREPFEARELIRRIAARTGLDEGTAEREARAVLTALARVVRKQEYRDLEQQLPADYQRLLHEAEKVAVEREAPVAAVGDVFVERVARHAALDPTEARRVAEAVAETLAERLAGGEVQDLAECLPEDLHPALLRGTASTGGKAQQMSLDEFVHRIAEREGTGWEQALEHARAVFAALRETLPYKEFSDILHELPKGYYEALL
ncbi:MAG TPA: DUF2267 domain-containing protein [Solirubrobacteraceae bacterium]|jgi:uncharacterized protein (DUF2267 family)